MRSAAIHSAAMQTASDASAANHSRASSGVRPPAR